MSAVAAWMFVLVVTAALGAAVLVPRISGSAPYTILTGSMRPHLPPGTLVVVKPLDVDDIAVGDVITYQLASGQPAVVTHRVVATSVNLKGERTLRTQGDTNNIADAEPVREVQIKGKLWYSIPYLGYVNKYITGKERHITMIVVVSFLLLYAAYMFTSAGHGRLRGGHTREDAP